VTVGKSILMCPPTHFEVAYEINAWMHRDDPVDAQLAGAQWLRLHETYVSLGYEVHLIQPADGLPDMVFTANGGLVIDGRAALPRFKHPERRPETPRFAARLGEFGYETFMPEHEFEGEGDCLFAGGTLFAGHGFRSDPRSHAELAEFFSHPVVSLRLVDPRFYHLDTAMCPLSDDTLMYYPGAFDEAGRRELSQRFAHLIEASVSDAAGFGLNAVSDGRRVVLSAAAHGLIDQLRNRGYEPIGLNMTEFRKSGGAVKCCSLELRGAGGLRGTG
jgi:N-dimethylarginine dimethylaminohydrolase